MTITQDNTPISASDRCLTKTGFPRHLYVTVDPTGIAEISNSAEASANTSAAGFIEATNWYINTAYGLITLSKKTNNQLTLITVSRATLA